MTFLRALYCSALLACFAPNSQAKVELPNIGENSAGLISPSVEYALGRQALRQYRAYFPQAQDPYFEAYLDRLLSDMVVHSGLPDKPLSLLVIDDSNLNAFAAPGGIVGVNTGTFLVAQTEQQLASIIAHELAHLSQRHYARRVAYQKSQTPLNIATLLGSILIMASGNGDAGIAAMTAAQARQISGALAFSRDMEREADRVGIETMVNAGYDPHAMPQMFEQLLRASRYRAKVPEFLLTHPVTESRISDAKNRSQNYPKRIYPSDEDFQIIKARAILRHESSPQFAVKRFTNELNGVTVSKLTARYGLVAALIASHRVDDAKREYEALAKEYGHLLAVRIARADIYAEEGRLDLALDILKRELAVTPSNHVLNVRYAEVLMQAARYELGQSVLTAHVKRQPENAYVWYLLAETHGLAGNILEVHKARAEYFILLGIYEKAEIQLRNGLKLIDGNDHEKHRLEQRLAHVRKLQNEKM
ncbi:MAG TPA: M48 family metalloprotease [Marinagarivorans sp.]